MYYFTTYPKPKLDESSWKTYTLEAVSFLVLLNNIMNCEMSIRSSTVVQMFNIVSQALRQCTISPGAQTSQGNQLLIFIKQLNVNS